MTAIDAALDALKITMPPGDVNRVESVYVSTTLKWLMYLPYVPFNTGVNTLTFGIQT